MKAKNEERDREIVAMRCEGKHPAVIAERFGITAQRVWGVLRVASMRDPSIRDAIAAANPKHHLQEGTPEGPPIKPGMLAIAVTLGEHGNQCVYWSDGRMISKKFNTPEHAWAWRRELIADGRDVELTDGVPEGSVWLAQHMNDAGASSPWAKIYYVDHDAMLDACVGNAQLTKQVRESRRIVVAGGRKFVPSSQRLMDRAKTNGVPLLRMRPYNAIQ